MKAILAGLVSIAVVAAALGEPVPLANRGPEAVEKVRVDKVSDAWIAFARTGNPNTLKLPRWPVFNAESRATCNSDSGGRLRNSS
jgi:carboxylesterase type B